MALPPKGHPDRPLRLAARSMMTLGVVLLIFSTCLGMTMVPGVLAVVSGAGVVRGWELLVLAVYLAPGLGFVVCSVQLKRYRAWAAIVGLVLAGLGLLVSLLMLLGFLVLAITAAGAGEVWTLVFLVIPVLFIAAFTQLIIHLSRSFKAIRIHEMQGPQGHGFVPIMPPRPAPDASQEPLGL